MKQWNECDYCNDSQPYKDCVLPDGTEQILCEFGNRPLPEYFVYERKIKFCPFCGKPLTEEAWAELESRIGGNDETTDKMD